MRRLLLAILLASGLVGPVYGQSQVIPLTGTPPAAVSPTNPLPVAPTASSASGTSTIATNTLAANLVVDANPGNLFSFNVSADSILSGAAWWIMIYNAAAAPSDGAVTPAKCYAMSLGTTSFSAAFPVPVGFSTGIVIGVSTTGCFTKTASTHAFISGDFK